MTTKGIVFRGEIQTYKLKESTESSKSFSLPYDKTLFIEGVKVPTDLLPAGWAFLDKWDMAVPLWRYGKTASDLGDKEEKKITQEVVGDLRVLIHSYELLFVKKSPAGIAFMQAWEKECKQGKDKRLAFLRALHLTSPKPKVCFLPTSWLAEVEKRNSKIKYRSPRRSHNHKAPLVKVELEPGRFVKVHRGDEEKAKEQFRRLRARRQ